MRSLGIQMLAICCAACAGTPPQPSEPRDSHPLAAEAERAARDPAVLVRDWLLRDLKELPTAEKQRARLEGDVGWHDLERVGFDDVSIAQCIDNIVAALAEMRRQPADKHDEAKLSEWLDLYLGAKREALVRRHAGAANCLPYIR